MTIGGGDFPVLVRRIQTGVSVSRMRFDSAARYDYFVLQSIETCAGAEPGRRYRGGQTVVQRIGLVLVFCAATAVMASCANAQTHGGSTDKRDYRYCEVLAINQQPGKSILQAWNTSGYNQRTPDSRDSCPEQQWAKFDAAAIAQQLHATCALLNGPHFWVYDSVKQSGGAASKPAMEIGGLTFALVATVSPVPEGCDFGSTPYQVHPIKRKTIWHYDAGKPVYELVSPSGDVYVMQSYSRIVDKTLKLSDLAGLGSVLQLPGGWSYKTETLTKPLDLVAPGVAFVTTDNLDDAYQRRLK